MMIFQGYAAILYVIGLILVLLYLFMSVDDFIWDIVTTFIRRLHKKQRLDFKALDTVPPKLLAVTVAAWHEEAVLGDVIDNFIASTSYPRSMYHIFLGTYPNDPPTLAVARALEERHDNVHVVLNDTPGPTSKAQNINHVIRQIRLFEQERGWEFASLTIHDSEDVVHPYELLVTNYLLDTHEALQFPVFPLIRMPRFSNFFKNITTGTYADEFAENHYTTM
ncbi:MAG: glycosyltransferase, partial [Bacillota bacterium]